MVYLVENEVKDKFYDFQHITKNCQTQSSLSRAENNAAEIKHYYDGNEVSN